MNFLADLKKINPKLKKTDNTLQFVTIEPTTGDWIMVTFIILAGIPLSWYTTYSMHYYYVVLSVYFLLAYSLVDDKFETIIDKEKNSIVVTKTKLGRKKWERASVADELIQVTTVNTGRSCTFKTKRNRYVHFGTGIHVRIWLLQTANLRDCCGWRVQQESAGNARKRNQRFYGIETNARLDEGRKLEKDFSKYSSCQLDKEGKRPIEKEINIFSVFIILFLFFN